MRLILIVALTALTTAASKPKPEIREIIATGCVVQSAQADCLLLTTLDGKTTYDIVADPIPEAGTVITIQGKPHQGARTCKQGIAVDVTKWEATGERCVR